MTTGNVMLQDASLRDFSRAQGVDGSLTIRVPCNIS